MEKTGVVRRIIRDTLYVEVERTGGCGDKCASCESKHCEVKVMEVPVRKTQDVSVGDLVVVDLSDDKFVRYTFILYMIPLFFFIGFIVLGYILFKGNEVLTLLSGFAGLLVAYMGVALYSRSIERNESVQLVRVYSTQSILQK